MKSVKYTFNTRPDSLGRRQFTIEWVDDGGVFRPELAPDGKVVGYRRGQVFFARPEEYIKRDRAAGKKVVVVDQEAAP